MMTRFKLTAFAWLLLACTLVGVQPSFAQLDSVQTWAGTATGSANALAITVRNVSSYTDLTGVPIRFIPALDNTDATTINVTGVVVLGAVAVKRPSSIGLVALSGHEFQAGVLTTVVFDGTNLQLVSPLPAAQIGSTIDLRGASAPPGYLIEDGSCVSQTTYAALFSVISTNFGSCSAGLFAIPDSRGSLNAALDNQGSGGSANRLTNAGSGCTATSVAFRCGAQNVTLARANLPNVTIGVGNGLNDPGHVHTQSISPAGGANGFVQAGVSGVYASSGVNTFSNTTGITLALNGGVGQTTTTTVPPLLGATRAIKY